MLAMHWPFPAEAKGGVLCTVRKAGPTDRKREGTGEAETWAATGLPRSGRICLGTYWDTGPARNTVHFYPRLHAGKAQPQHYHLGMRTWIKLKGPGHVPMSQRIMFGDPKGYRPGHTIQEAPTSVPSVSGPSLGSHKANWQMCYFLQLET